MINEMNRISDQLRRSFDGDAWAGPSISDIVSGISAETAASRPIANAHTILEIVLHMTAWNRVVQQRLAGEHVGSLGPAKDFPAGDETDPEQWTGAVAELGRQITQLCTQIEATEDRRLQNPTPEETYSVYQMLHGVIQHNLYHAGQIVLLAKTASDQEVAPDPGR